MKKEDFIYLDYNASTPHDPEVVEAMMPYLLERYGNPSSAHSLGRIAKIAVDTARKQVADLLHATAEEIVFTSGGTEANNYAIIGAAHFYRSQGNHIITSSIEHPAVLEVCKSLEKTGFEVTYLPVDTKGIIDIHMLEKAIKPTTILISIMHANNETGAIQPIRQIGEIAQRNHVVFHTDAAQSLGKIPVDVEKMHIDLLSVAGHKMYAPKGVGALYVRKGIHLKKIMFGAGHEFGIRPGTENVPYIVGLGKASELAMKQLEYNQQYLSDIKSHLKTALLKEKLDFVVNGTAINTLPNTLNISFRNVDARKLLERCKEVIGLSVGSACHSGKTIDSEILKAVLPDMSYAKGTFRFSVGKYTTKEEVERAAKILAAEIHA
ncbi:cysteine desulfurase [Aquimarina sp. TRL1]|uniref:cysteine desulfurase family protein n=1 Tax=Aquimarina sp. (strain TRL1) TaxID=2736252 RepID=UPI00158A6F88|nr:cysteine desulfurase family protein [Aquimarina sp. TRL1]QKX06698.1 cysteine desulfurase [Aquimarina sp. TRL1]